MATDARAILVPLLLWFVCIVGTQRRICVYTYSYVHIPVIFYNVHNLLSTNFNYCLIVRLFFLNVIGNSI